MPQPLPKDLSPQIIPPTLGHHAIPLVDYSSTRPLIAGLCIGALIFRFATPTSTPQILLIKRASTNKSFANCWEIPGGSVEKSDVNILEGVVREVWEETGLRVKRFVRQVWDAKGGVDGGGGEVEFLGGRGERWCKLCFLVEVGEGEVVVDREEHQDWGWYGRSEIGALEMVSKQAGEIIENGFEIFGNGG